MIRFKTLLTELKKIKRGFPHTIERSWENENTGPETNSHIDDSDPEINNRNLINPKRSLTNDELEAVKAQKRRSRGVNDFLRGNKPTAYDTGLHSDVLSDDMKREFQDRAGYLSSAIRKHKTSGDMYVYRGIYDNQIKHFLKRKSDVSKRGSTRAFLVRDKGFGEYSLDHRESNNFGNDTPGKSSKAKGLYSHTLKVHVPKGSRALFTGPYGEHETERGVFLNKGHRLAVDRKPTFDNKRGLITWHANLIHDGTEYTSHATHPGKIKK